MKILHIGYGFRPWRGGGLIEYAEDLMDIQAAHGHEVAYFFAGRQYPLVRKPWLKKWSRGNIRMYEIVNSPINFAFERGTKYPESHLREEYSESFFLQTLAQVEPDLIHIQELAGLPSSLLEIINQKNIPVLMTLQDYFPLCPTLKLYDYSSSLCLKQQVGADCVRCCAQAPWDAEHLIELTINHEATRFKRALPTVMHTPARRLKRLAGRVVRHARTRISQPRAQRQPRVEEPLAQVFQDRREVNIERLNTIDLLVAQSYRVAEIYRTLGVQASRIQTVHLTLKHIDQIQSKQMNNVSRPVRFATLNGCVSNQKGALLILGALRQLKELGLSSGFQLVVLGGVLDSIRDELSQYENVLLSGFYQVSKLDNLLEDIHVGIIPSIWEEAYGFTGIEFLAKGIPVIGNRMGGIVDYTVNNVTGWVNQPNTAGGLTQIMADIVRRPEQIVQLNQSILSNYRRFIKPMGGHFEEMERLYTEVIRAKHKRALSDSVFA